MMMKWVNFKLIILGLLSCVLLPVTQASSEQAPDAAAQTSSLLYVKGERSTFISVGRYTGIDDSKEINISHVSFGKTYYVTDGLGLNGEILAMVPQGERDGVDADAEGIGVFFSLRWHFLRAKSWSLFLNHGIGPVLFVEEFPPGGTKLNGLIQYGLGVSTRLGISTLLTLGARHIHISNGKGFVDDNPSYDGRGAFFEIAKQF